MTIGIYALYWEEQDLIYIGQSKEIERRLRDHLKQLRDNNHYNYKVQGTFNTYGKPDCIVIEKCSILELDLKEIQWIKEFSATLNILPGGFGTGKDTKHGASKFSKLEILNAVSVLILNPNKELKEISDITGMSTSVLSTIANLNKHTWLESELDPGTLEKLKASTEERRLKNKKPSKNAGKFLVPSDGKLFVVEHIANFAKEHKLTESKVWEVLSGARKTHKGWKISA